MTPNKLDWALHYASMGLKIFPVHSNGKRPIHNDWPDLATSDPAQIADWWREWPDANIGCTPGASGHVVIDVDTKKVDGHQALTDLQVELGKLPETMRTKTPSGGVHVWLKMEGSCKNSAGSLAPGIDTRGRRGVVVMGGSSIDGKDYTTKDFSIAAAPEQWTARLGRLGERDENRSAVTDEMDLPHNIERAQEYIEYAVSQGDVAIEGQGGDDRTFRLFTKLRDYGLSEDKAVEIAAPWNSACIPPWDQDEFELKAENAYNYAQNEAGARALTDDGTGFAAIKTNSGTGTPPAGPSGQEENPFKPLTMADMRKLPEPDWLVEDWIPHYELTMLYGPYGSMKSFIALDIALNVAYGRASLGVDYEPKQHPVMYIAGEGQYGIAQQRVPAWCAHHGLEDTDNFQLIPHMPMARNGAADLAKLFSAIETDNPAGLPRLIVIDTHARSMSGLDENTAQDTSKAVEFYQQLSKRYSCAVLIIHHSGVDPTRERGSSSFGGSCASILYTEYDQPHKVLTLNCKRHKDADKTKAIHFEPVIVEEFDSVVLERKKFKQKPAEAPQHSELYNDVVATLNTLGAYSFGDAVETKILASSMPAVQYEVEPDAIYRATRKMTAILERNAKKELRPLIHGDEKPLQWHLPPITE